MDCSVFKITGMVMLIFFIDNSNEMSCLLIPPKTLMQDLDLNFLRIT